MNSFFSLFLKNLAVFSQVFDLQHYKKCFHGQHGAELKFYIWKGWHRPLNVVLALPIHSGVFSFISLLSLDQSRHGTYQIKADYPSFWMVSYILLVLT